MAPIDTLLGLLDELDGLNRKQANVIFMRHACPTDQRLQLEMDRRQTEINTRRAQIQKLMTSIAMSN